jgi:hypothetical protein
MYYIVFQKTKLGCNFLIWFPMIAAGFYLEKNRALLKYRHVV